MTNEVMNIEEIQPLSIPQVKAQVNAIQDVLNNVMIQDTHYGTIAGCGSGKVLLKPGAEKILATFQIGAEIIIEDLFDGYDYRYRIICRGFHIPTGNTVGYGAGECSSAEKKYSWREAVCGEEFEETTEDRRQKYWKKGYREEEATCIKQVRQNPADLANTVLKMAKKRAMVDLCLTATACSDIFEQDIDEEHLRDAVGVKAKTYQQPKAKEQPQHPSGDFISDGQSKRLYAIRMSVKMPQDVLDDALKAQGINSDKEIPKSTYDSWIEWVQGYTA